MESPAVWIYITFLPSSYPMETLTLIFGGFILLCFLLVKNELPTIFRAIRRGDFQAIFDYSTSLFAIICFAISYVLLTTVVELSPGSQVQFFFFGGYGGSRTNPSFMNFHEIFNDLFRDIRG